MSTAQLQLTSSSLPIAQGSLDRLPPHSLDAEQALLGALLHNNLAFERVAEFLRPEHFSDPSHGRIYEAISLLISRGHIADPITLKEYFDRDDTLSDVGGGQYLAQLANSVLSIINTEDYGRKIHDFYLRRQLIDVGEDIVNNAHTYDLDVSATNQIESAEKQLFDLATIGQKERGLQTFSSALKQALVSAEVAYKRDSHVIGVTTGFKKVDECLGGFHPSDLIIVAGRPSMGKTALVTNFAFNAARQVLEKNEGASVAFFSLEMSAEQLANRILGQESGLSSDLIRRGDIGKSDFPRLVEVSNRLNSLQLFIDDTPGLSVPALRTRARRLKRQEGLGMIIIDYLQLLSSAGKKSAENRVLELSEITRHLKALAKELHVPVLACSQLSRAVEQRDDKRPQLSDLRESGSIEQDADVVMFVYREEYYLSRKKPTGSDEKVHEWEKSMNAVANIAEIIIAKQRHGPIGTVQLHFEGRLTKFSDLADPAYLAVNNA
ncbi:MAG: replicative DNA helicase [Alphaproteobacteria bacterium]|jgi:replicative DNA helicase|nr:replicative DNA helicase [Alphaproteobacteria bacterium]MBP9777228.1 replicative DNA helicase [Alphaproteobacteria bacterium]